MTKEDLKIKNGITLIACIITIIILLILAGLSISLVVGQNGIINKAKLASEETKEKAAEEKFKLALTQLQVSKNGENIVLTDLNQFQDPNSENYNNAITLEKTINQGDTSSNVIVDKKYKFQIDNNCNIVYIGESKDVQLADGLINYTTFDDPFSAGSLKEEISNTEYSNENGVSATNANKKIGAGSAYFTGTSGQRLQLSNPKLNLGTSDFTVEFWVCPDQQVMPYPMIFGSDNNVNLEFFICDSVSGGNIALVSGSSYDRIINTGKKYTPGVWTNYALVRKNGVFTIYENGINIGQTSEYATRNVDISNLSIGGDCITSSTSYKGYMDDFAMYDYAKYNANYTPQLKANNDANLLYSSFDDYKIDQIKDTVSNQEYQDMAESSFAISDSNYKYGRSGYFKGENGQRLQLSNPKLNLGTSDFTVEFWVYPDQQVMPYSMIFGSDDNVNLEFFICDGVSGGNIALISGSSYDRIINTGKQYTPNIWTNYALVRKNGVFTIYENGINIGQTSEYVTRNVDISNFSIGGDCITSSTAYKGYMDDFAIYNYAKYSGNYTVSNSPSGIK